MVYAMIHEEEVIEAAAAAELYPNILEHCHVGSKSKALKEGIMLLARDLDSDLVASLD